MICNPRAEKNFAAIEALIQKEIPRIENPLKSGAAVSDSSDDTKPKRTSRSRTRKDDQPVIAAVETDSETETSVTERSGDKPKQRRGRRSGDRRDDNNKTVGMGDHLPGFIAMSFEQRRAG